MALDDASPQGSGNPSAYASTDPSQGSYNPTMPKPFPVQIRPELIVKPDALTLYFGFFGARNWKRNVADVLTRRAGDTWVLTGRSPTQDELDAMTTLSSRSLYHKRAGLPISYFVGTGWLYYQARRSPMFPKNPTPANLLAALHKFRIEDRAGFMAVLGRTAFRMLFLTSSIMMVSNFTALWGEARNSLSDPRMQSFIDAVHNAKPEDVNRRKLAIANERYRRTKANEKNIISQIEGNQGLSGSYDQGEQAQYGYDNASPAAVSSESDMAYGTSQVGQSAPAQQSYSAPASREQQAYGQYGPAQGTGNRPSQADSGSDFFFGSSDDDASPTAPEYRNTNMDGRPAGSAWERIRQQRSSQGSRPSAPGQASMQWGQAQAQSRPEAANDSLPSDQDKYDYDRRREKDQAQADFNKMIEAERNASSDGPPRNRNW